MKFILETAANRVFDTSDTSPPPHKNATKGIVTYTDREGLKRQDHAYFIELETLDQLMMFVEETGFDLIMRLDKSVDVPAKIIIYDDYIE